VDRGGQAARDGNDHTQYDGACEDTSSAEQWASIGRVRSGMSGFREICLRLNRGGRLRKGLREETLYLGHHEIGENRWQERFPSQEGGDLLGPD